MDIGPHDPEELDDGIPGDDREFGADEPDEFDLPDRDVDLPPETQSDLDVDLQRDVPESDLALEAGSGPGAVSASLLEWLTGQLPAGEGFPDDPLAVQPHPDDPPGTIDARDLARALDERGTDALLEYGDTEHLRDELGRGAQLVVGGSDQPRRIHHIDHQWVELQDADGTAARLPREHFDARLEEAAGEYLRIQTTPDETLIVIPIEA